jgi:hypothetical protein
MTTLGIVAYTSCCVCYLFDMIGGNGALAIFSLLTIGSHLLRISFVSNIQGPQEPPCIDDVCIYIVRHPVSVNDETNSETPQHRTNRLLQSSATTTNAFSRHRETSSRFPNTYSKSSFFLWVPPMRCIIINFVRKHRFRLMDLFAIMKHRCRQPLQDICEQMEFVWIGAVMEFAAHLTMTVKQCLFVRLLQLTGGKPSKAKSRRLVGIFE